jgi:hypothetical protein
MLAYQVPCGRLIFSLFPLVVRRGSRVLSPATHAHPLLKFWRRETTLEPGLPPKRKISQILPTPKNKLPLFQSEGIYKVECLCGKCYIGQTGRSSSMTRRNQHWRNTNSKMETTRSTLKKQ